MNNDFSQEPIQSGEYGSTPGGSVGANDGFRLGDQPHGVTSEGGEKTSTVKMVGWMALVLLLVAGGVFGLLKLINGEKTSTSEPCPDEPTQIEVSEFDLSFLKLENNAANEIYSPLSIKHATSLLRDGASGETRAEIDNVLGNIELTKYDNIEGVLGLANAVLIREDFADNVKQSYILNAKQAYNAEIIYDSFADSLTLDNWVDNKTFGLIKTSGANVTPDSRMILANALAIQMDWARKFDTVSTYGAEFTKADGTVINATTMSIKEDTDDVKYYKDDDITVVSKDLQDYDGTQLEFIAVMPEGDLSSYVEGIKADDLSSLLRKRVGASTVEGGVILNIPKFKYDYQLDFINDLKSLGINLAFGVTADFSEMSEPNELMIGDAIHKATIDFSEDGIKAAAITVFVMDIQSVMMESQPLAISINKPFLFLIRDKKNGENWFVGTVYEPNLWESDRQTYSM